MDENMIEELAQMMEEDGLILKGPLVLDDKAQRVPTTDKPKSTNGWYIGNPEVSVTFGDWAREGEHRTWYPNGKSKMTSADREVIRRRIEEAKAERERTYKAGAAAARAAVAKAKPCPETFPYLKGKGIKPHEALFTGNKLLLDIRNIDGEVTSVQLIDKTGEYKMFQTDGRVGGCFHTIAGSFERIYICEGFATGATINEATGMAVIVAFNAGNLDPITKHIKSKYPKVPITICADNDHKRDVNVGLNKGKAVAKAFGLEAVWPEDIDGTDFNDMAQELGLDAVKELLGLEAPEPTPEEPIKEDNQVDDHGPEQEREQNMDKKDLTLEERMVYIEEGNLVADLTKEPQNSLLKLPEFRVSFGNLPMVERVGLPKITAPNHWLQSPDRRTVRGVRYEPAEERIFSANGEEWINCFHRPIWGQPNGFNKIGILTNHLEKILPIQEEREVFIQWMACTVHRPEVRPGFTPLLISQQHGLGRGWIVKLMEALLGAWNCSATKMKTLAGQGSEGNFQNYLFKTLFCSIPEVKVDKNRYDVDDEIRDKLTDSPLNLNIKYGDMCTYNVYTNFLLASNHRDALVISEEDRRIFATETDEDPPPEEYFAELIYPALKDEEFVKQVFWWLKEQMSPTFNPYMRAPKTDARSGLIESAKGDLEGIYDDMVEDTVSARDVVCFSNFRKYAEDAGFVWYEEHKNEAMAVLKRRAKLVNGGEKMNINGYPKRLYAIRNVKQWTRANRDQIRSEYRWML